MDTNGIGMSTKTQELVRGFPVCKPVKNRQQEGELIKITS